MRGLPAGDRTGLTCQKWSSRVGTLHELKIAPVLSRHHVEPGQYQKMRVSTAAQLLSHSTASVLRFCVQNGTLENDALTTAWFVDFINKWFDVVNARHYQFAMTPFSTDSVQVLHEMVDLASKVMFSGKRCSWKPIQTGLLLSTHSIIGLYTDLVGSGLYRYLLPGRLTQDPLENFFSQVSQLVIPTHLQLISGNG